MIVAIPKETHEGEKRVAVVPETIGRLAKLGLTWRVQTGAGVASHIADAEYREKGAEVVDDPVAGADLVIRVREPGDAAIAAQREGSALIALMWPLQRPQIARALAARRITAWSMDLMPRISRAQSMDVLSSMSSLAGYKCVLLAADLLPKHFPMLMTAAGTIPPARVLVIGAGVAGLQAIATARRLGAVVEAYDVRPVVKEQVESLGARFVDLKLETADAQDKGGYAKQQSEEVLRRQREGLADRCAANDVVITTALIPGRPAPKLVTADGVRRMKPGSVIIDLAAENGGNCELTRIGTQVVEPGVTIVGVIDVPSSMAPDASRLYSRNIGAFLPCVVKEGKLVVNRDDEVVRGPLIAHEGEVVHEGIMAALAAGGVKA